MLLWTGPDTVKGKLIKAAGRFTITAQVEEYPYRYVAAEGPVVAFETPAPVEEVKAIAVRYLGPEQGEKFIEENFQAESLVLIRMRPERWLSTDYRKA